MCLISALSLYLRGNDRCYILKISVKWKDYQV
nr:MAG TPA: hypothetical protein [Caudoviricetes sp.]